MADTFPIARAGQVIGLLGGSFDPAHSGHAHITRYALKRFGLDRVWWLVSPGNPLKVNGPAPIAARIEAAREVMRHPKVTITAVEQRLGTRYTAQTIATLSTRYRGVRFVWLMGADNLAQFDKWQDWQTILETVPIGVLARPGYQNAARSSKAAQMYRNFQIPARRSHLLGRSDAPQWCYVNLPLSEQSSSAIRARGEW